MSMISAHPSLSRTMQGEDMLQADEVVAMLRLHELGWGASAYRKSLAVLATLSGDICGRAEQRHFKSRFAALLSMAWMTGCANSKRKSGQQSGSRHRQVGNNRLILGRHVSGLATSASG